MLYISHINLAITMSSLPVCDSDFFTLMCSNQNMEYYFSSTVKGLTIWIVSRRISVKSPSRGPFSSTNSSEHNRNG